MLDISQSENYIQELFIHIINNISPVWYCAIGKHVYKSTMGSSWTHVGM